MKAFNISTRFMMAVFLFIMIVMLFVNLLYVDKVKAAISSFPEEKVECKINSDCRNRGVCMSINGQANFCGCLDEEDCGGANCVYNRCS